MKGLKKEGKEGGQNRAGERERPHRIETRASMMSMEMVKLRGWRTRVPFFLDLFCLVLRSVRSAFCQVDHVMHARLLPLCR
jgi:hypothetical protein